MKSSRLVAFVEATVGSASSQRCARENRGNEFGWFDFQYLMAGQALSGRRKAPHPSADTGDSHGCGRGSNSRVVSTLEKETSRRAKLTPSVTSLAPSSPRSGEMCMYSPILHQP